MSLGKKPGVVDALTRDKDAIVQAFRLEAVYKKYKTLIFVLLAISIVLGAFFAFNSYKKSKNEEESRSIIFKLQSASAEEKTELESKLKSLSPVLHDYYIYTKLQDLPASQLLQEENLAMLDELSKSKHPLIAALASYQRASLTKDAAKLEAFDPPWKSQEGADSSILRDRARLQAAYLYLQNNEIEKAHEILDSIAAGNGRMRNLAKGLRHYGIETNNPGSPSLESK